MQERLQKLMAQANVGSRRASEALIERGRVRVNGKVATLGDKADPQTDIIEVDGVRLKFDQAKLYYALNKPINVVTTTKAQRQDDRATIVDYIPVSDDMHLFMIGRLDADSEGLVVLTNDGELAHRLSHPSFRHTKTYRVVVDGLPTAETLEEWQRGMWLGDEEGMTAPCYIEITKGGNQSVLKIVMTEGKKRQIRRVGAMLGHAVRELRRVQIGRLELGRLKPGEWRQLEAHEIELLSQRSPDAKLIPRRRPGGTQSPRSETNRSSDPIDDAGQTPRQRPTRLVDDDARARPRRSSENERQHEQPRRLRPGDPSSDRPSSRTRPPREESERPRRAPSDRPHRDGDNRPRRAPTMRRTGADYETLPAWRREGQKLSDQFEQENTRRPPRHDSDSASSERPRRPTGSTPAGGSRPPRRDSDSASSDRPRRPSGSTPARGSRPPRRDGDSASSDRPRRPSGSTPARGSRPPRPSSETRPSRPPRRRDEDDDA